MAPAATASYFEPLHPKLQVGAVNDPAEHAADAFAERVMGGQGASWRGSPGASTMLHRKCAACDEEATLRRKESTGAGGGQAPTVVHQALASSGHGLDQTARARIESRGGPPLAGVRIHTDALAAESARAVGARAYTVGRDIVFGAGEYQPSTPEGLRLIAHEVGHLGAGVLRRAAIDPVDSPSWPVELRDTIEDTLRQGRVGSETPFNPVNAGITSDVDTAVAKGMDPNQRAALVENYARWSAIGLPWRQIKRLKWAWNEPPGSRGMYLDWKDVSAVWRGLDANTNMCVDTLAYEHPEANRCWRERVEGHPGLHICVGGGIDQSHVDPIQIMKKWSIGGNCVPGLKASVQHGRSELPYFKKKYLDGPLDKARDWKNRGEKWLKEQMK